MSMKIKYEIQVEDPKAAHGWKAVGHGADGQLYFTEDNRINTRVNTIEEARKARHTIRHFWMKSMIKERELRIVKVTVVTTYDVVE